MGRVNSSTICLPSSCPTRATLSAAYDLAGNMTSLTYPDGRVVQQGFDGAGRMSNSNYLSWNGTSVNQPYFSAGATNGYDAAGHLVNATFGNGVPLSAGYDTRERIGSLSYGASTAPVWSKQYAWTSNSNIQSSTDLITGVQRQFGYDNLNRIAAAQDIFSNLAVPSGSNGETGSTTTSGSGATSTPGESGAIQEWTNPDDSNLLLEMSAPNSGWGSYYATPTPNAAIAPDGTMSATSVSATSGSVDSYVTGQVPNPADYSLETMTGSVWLRSVSGTQAVNLYLLELSPAGLTIAGSNSAQLTTTWQQFQVTGAMVDNLTRINLQIGGGGTVTGGESFLMWNPMLEDMGVAGTSVTNFLPYSQQTAGVTWGLSATLSAPNSGTAPDGSQTATTITANNGSGFAYVYDKVLNPSPYNQQVVTESVFLKTTSGSFTISIWFGEASGGSAQRLRAYHSHSHYKLAAFQRDLNGEYQSVVALPSSGWR
jgi:YD repeat-containing protein